MWIWIWGADLKAHRPPGEGLDGFPNDPAYWLAMPYDALPGPQRASPSAVGVGGWVVGVGGSMQVQICDDPY